MSIEDVKKFEPLFGSWYVKEQLGKGSYGEVYLIEREDALGIRSQSALKYMHISPAMSASSTLNMDHTTNGGVYYDDIAQDIVKEIQIMSSLKGCSNIVSYEDHDCIPLENAQGWDIIIRMELLTSLNDYVKDHQMTEQDTIRLGVDICNALIICQENNIIHRDIKPGNIMVSENGNYKIGDFGIARTVERGTMGGFSRKGTAPYMAPEIYRGEAYSGSVDIYSLGIVMYQLLNNGRIPFMPPYPEPIRPADEENAMFRRLQGETIPAPSNGSPELHRIILKACAFKSEDRYSDPGLMRKDLESLAVQTQNIQIRYLDSDDTVLASRLYLPGEPVQIPVIPEREIDGKKYKVSDWQPTLPKCAEKSGDYYAVWKPVKKSKLWIFLAGIGAVVIIAAVLCFSGVFPLPPQPTPTPTIIVEPPTQPTITVEPPRSTSDGDNTPMPRVEKSTLEWTDWDDAMPDGVTGENYAIECRQVFRSTPLISVHNNEYDPGEGYELFETTYGDWGEWSAYQAFPVEENETIEMDEPLYQQSWVPVNKSTMNRSLVPSGVNYWAVSLNDNHTATRYEWDAGYYNKTVTYRYRTREVTKYYFNKDSWSPYQDGFVQQEDDVLVGMKMQYRYAKNDGEAFRDATMDNFATAAADYQGHYYDVPANAWYSPEKSRMLQTVDELGILLPDSYMRFRPEENMTIGQLIRAAVVINRIYNGYEGLICKNDGQYQAYAKYAEDAGLIVKGEFPDLDRSATRQEMAYVFYNALPLECLESINQIDSITDMDMSRKYYECALTMARAGVISVSEGNTFHPEDGATRAQAAAMIEKLVHPNSRTKA